MYKLFSPVLEFGETLYNFKKEFAITAFFLILFNFQSYSQNPVTGSTTTAVAATSSSYTEGGQLYEWGLGNDLILETVDYNGETYFLDNTFTQTSYDIIRVDGNGGISFDRFGIFADEFNDNNFQYDPTLPDPLLMSTLLDEPIINRGANDIFKNDNSAGTGQNIERVDVLYVPFKIPNLPNLEKVGFLATEKNGNSSYKCAAITSVDALGKPASYGPLITIQSGDYGSVTSNFQVSFLANATAGGNPTRSGAQNEDVGVSFVSLSDLGIGINDTVYGISFFDSNVVEGTHDLLDPTTFPDAFGGGADIHGGLGAVVTSIGTISGTIYLDINNNGTKDSNEPGIPNVSVKILGSDGGIQTVVTDSNGDYSGFVSGGNTTITINESDPDLPPNYARTEGNNPTTVFAIEGQDVPIGNTGYSSDFDNDGVVDFTDIDDDNDGILDTIEQECIATPTGTVSDSGGTGIDESGDGINNLQRISDGDKTNDIGIRLNRVGEYIVLDLGEVKTSGTIFNFFFSLGAPANDVRTIRISQLTNDTFVSNGGTNPLEITQAQITPGIVSEFNYLLTENTRYVQFEMTVRAGGRMDIIESEEQTCNLTLDTDNDGIINSLDLDSDNDGIPDNIEAQTTNGYIAPNTDSSTTYTTNDGINSAYLGGLNPVDSDSATVTDNPDYLDLDSDEDGASDTIEANLSLSGTVGTNGLDSFYDNGDDYTDVNGSFDDTQTDNFPDNGNNASNGLPDDVDWRDNTVLGEIDTDNDGIPNSTDIDDDNDGVLDVLENSPNLPAPDAYYNFENNTQDSSGNDHDQQNGATPEYNTDNVLGNNSIDFDGSYLIQYNDDPFLNKEIIASTHAVWIKPDNLTGKKIIIDEGGTTNGIAIYLDGNSLEAFAKEDTTTGGTASLTFPADGDWHHVAFVFTSSDYTLYLDGVPSTPVTTTFGSLSAHNNGSGLGGINGNSITTGNNFSGLMDEYAHYDVALTAAQVLSLASLDSPLNSDSDNFANYLDLDSDNDGIPDNIEAQPTNSYVAPTTFTDIDNDGLDDNYDGNVSGGTSNSYLSIENTDGAGDPDYLDLDSDDDGTSDRIEANLSLSGTVGANGLDNSYDNGDNYADVNGSFDNTPFNDFPDNPSGGEVDWRDDTSTFSDNDNDGIVDSVDLDDDNDGILDIDEKDLCVGSLKYEFYDSVPLEFTVDNIPTIENATQIGEVSDFDVDALFAEVTPGDGDEFSVRYTGVIRITTSETYTFYTSSDDGSKLFIDDVEIVDNDGAHAVVQESGTIDLIPGDYKITVLFFENSGGESLQVQYSTPTITQTDIPFSTLYNYCNKDTDADGLADSLDLDSDNDGIPDNIEAQTTQGYVFPDGVFDSDGVDTAYTGGLTPVDTDLDGDEDYIETDSDNDGLDDTTEAGLTLSGTVGTNGLDNNYDNGDNYTDVNGSFDNTQTDNFPDEDQDVFNTGDVDYRDATFTIDIDQDGIPNEDDIDDDNDGILDTVEGLQSLLTEKGFTDLVTPSFGDNVGATISPWVLESGTDTNVIRVDGTGGSTYGTGGPEFDATGGAGNYFTVDGSDGVIYQTFTLAEESVIDYGGFISGRDGNTGNGSIRIYSGTGTGGTLLSSTGPKTSSFNSTWKKIANTITLPAGTYSYAVIMDENLNFDEAFLFAGIDDDGDGIVNHYDLDSDNDGIPDNIEAQSTSGYIPPSGGFSLSGLDLAYGSGFTPENTDGTDEPDYLDLDSDNDGAFDIVESGAGLTDADSDGVADGAPSVFGVNGLIDSLETDDTDQAYTDVNGEYDSAFTTVFTDTDGDVDMGGDLDYRDNVVGLDTDGDGVPDVDDIDDDNDGILDINEGISQATLTGPSPESGYLFKDRGPTNLILVDGADGSSTAGGTVTGRFNAVALNEADGYIWGIERNTSKLVILDPNTLAEITIPGKTLPTISGFAGGYNPVLKVYVSINGAANVNVIDADPNSATYTEILKTYTNGATNNTADIIYNSSDGFFYGIRTNTNELIQYDIINESTTNLGAVSGIVSGAYGAAYATFDGSLFFNDNATGNTYLVDPETLTGTLSFTTVASSDNDGAKVRGVDFDGNTVFRDFDEDGIPDYLDIDSDNDGIPDNIEAQSTLGYIAPTGLDDDGDGLDNAYDSTPNGTAAGEDSLGLDLVNTDENLASGADSLPDYLDDDSDGDGKLDIEENGFTDNAISGVDSDNDGLDDNFEGADVNDGYDVNDEINNPSTDLPDEDSDVATEDVDYRDEDTDVVTVSVEGNVLWLRADMEVTGTTTVTQWDDQSDGAFIAQSTSGTEPVKIDGGLNFNPTIDFSPNDRMVITDGIFGTATYTNMWTYLVTKSNTVSGIQIIASEELAGTDAYLLGLNNDALVHQTGANTTRYSQTVSDFDSEFGLYTLGVSNTAGSAPSGFNQSVSKNGLILSTDTEAIGFTGNDQDFALSGQDATTSLYDGEVAEIIIINETPTSLKQQQIESYLAIKYGITLDNTDNDADVTEGDYILADQTTKVWDFSANSTYHNDVAGIGRDDAMVLNQKQSKSINSDAIVTIGLDAIATTNQTNANTFSTNKDFLMWGNNNGSLLEADVTETELICAPEKTLGRIWKVVENGNVPSVQIAADQTTIDDALTTANTVTVFKVADDASFTNNVEYIPVTVGTGDASGNYILDYDFNGTKYFTYAEVNGIFWNGDANAWTGGNSSSVTGGPSTDVADRDKVMVIDAETSLTHATLTENVEVECLWVKENSKLAVQDNMYLEFDEDFILDGEVRLLDNGQLVQTHTGPSNVQGNGKLYRDQAATVPNVYRYHYWSSPVRELGLGTYRVKEVMKDGNAPTSLTSTIREITWEGEGTIYDGAAGTVSPDVPIKIAPYWIYTFLNGSSGNDWVQSGEEAPIKRGQGYTMKSTGQTPQNFTFVGTPNDGSILFDVNAGTTNLLGNPYPSALDAVTFISTNLGAVEGSVYFWEHTGEDSTSGLTEGHNFRGYQGGYSQRNISMGIAASSVAINPVDDDNNPDLGSGTYNAPNRYIPVGQGFFISCMSNDSEIRFENSMRAFEDDNYTTDGSGGGTGTLFFKENSKNTITENNLDLLPILKLGFDYVSDNNVDLHRQIGISFRRGHDFKYDNGYDTEIYDLANTDFYWSFPNYSDKKLIIAGVSEITNQLRVPLVFEIGAETNVRINIDQVKNIESYIFLEDSITGETTELTEENPLTLTLGEGTYENRYFLTFSDNQSKTVLSTEKLENNDISVYSSGKKLFLQNESNLIIESIEVYSILGQKVKVFKEIENTTLSEYDLKTLSSNVYIVKVLSENGVFSKKIFLE
ncbi:PA14 domain-containing protein [Polaribacter sp.]|nr:PA14 domain-containing protein [Polaribacter sp.]